MIVWNIIGCDRYPFLFTAVTNGIEQIGQRSFRASRGYINLQVYPNPFFGRTIKSRAQLAKCSFAAGCACNRSYKRVIARCIYCKTQQTERCRCARAYKFDTCTRVSGWNFIPRGETREHCATKKYSKLPFIYRILKKKKKEKKNEKSRKYSFYHFLFDSF